MRRNELEAMLKDAGLCAIDNGSTISFYDGCGQLVRVLIGNHTEQNILTIKTYLLEYKRQQKADRKKQRETK